MRLEIPTSVKSRRNAGIIAQAKKQNKKKPQAKKPPSLVPCFAPAKNLCEERKSWSQRESAPLF